MKTKTYRINISSAQSFEAVEELGGKFTFSSDTRELEQEIELLQEALNALSGAAALMYAFSHSEGGSLKDIAERLRESALDSAKISLEHRYNKGK